ncbi:MAG: DUF4224 domain-containing protein [Burkholderiales bacterium]|nr:DUF4224 domain-containing protein [Burkholderiales bacterium]
MNPAPRELLGADELAELTGYVSARGQRRWLDARGWSYAVARDGSPRVARAYFLLRMGVPTGETQDHATEPNWQAIA